MSWIGGAIHYIAGTLPAENTTRGNEAVNVPARLHEFLIVQLS